MKKDPHLEKQLDEFIEGIEAPAPALLEPALRVLRAQNAQSAQAKGRGKKRSPWLLFGLPAAATAAILLLILIPYSLLRNSGGDGRSSEPAGPLVYSMTALTAIAPPPDADGLFPVLTHISGAEIYYELTGYALSGEVVLVEYRARRIARYAIEDIRIYAELTELCAEELAYFTQGAAQTYAQNPYRYRQYREGGEYYAEFYAETDAAKYYLEVMSPREIDKSDYLENLF
jgi:hypothetical protein